MRIKLKANRQTGANGVWVPHPLAKCICGRKGRGPAPQAQRSYYWCCYAAIIGAATQLLLVLLRSYYWCGYAAIIGAATQLLLVRLPRRISRAAFRDQQGGSAKAATTADQQGPRRRATRSTRRNAQKSANEMCLCFQVQGFNVIFEI